MKKFVFSVASRAKLTRVALGTRMEYTRLHEQQWFVCWWLNPIQSLIKSARHYILATRTVI